MANIPIIAKTGMYIHTYHLKEWRVLSMPIAAIAMNIDAIANPLHHTLSKKLNKSTIAVSWCAAPIIPKPDIASHEYNFILDKKGVGDKSIDIVEENSDLFLLPLRLSAGNRI